MAHICRLALLAAVATLGLAFGTPAQAGTQTLVFTSGPVTVTPYDAITRTALIDSPAVDGYVTGIKADLVDAGGNVVPNTQVMLHHVVFAKIGAPDYTCPGTYAQRFFAEGEEHYAMSMPDGYGYPNKASDHWGLLAMLMNHLPDTHTVWVRYTVTYATGEQLRPVKPIWLDMNNCKADPIYDIPGTGGPGSTYSRHVDLTMPESGRLLTAGGHMHGGGMRLELSDQTCGANALHLPAELERADPASAAARAGPDQDVELPEPARNPGRRRRRPTTDRGVRQQPPAHARDGDHDRLPGTDRGRRL